MFRYIDIASISNRTLSISGHKEYLGADAPSRARKRVRTGDVLVATTRPYLRTIAVVPPQYDGAICSTGLCVLRSGDEVLPQWLFAAALSQDVTRELVSKMRGASYPAVTDRDVFDTCIPAPPPAEQRRILTTVQECLARIEEVRSLQEQCLSEAQALATAYMSEIETSMGWPLLSVDELIVDSQNGRSIRSEGDSGNGRVLTLSAVREVALNLSLAKTVPLEDRTARAFAIEAGDVFVSRSNTMDLVGLASVALESGPSNTIYPDLLIRLKPNRDKVFPLFLAYALRFPSVRRQIRDRAKGTSRSMVKISGAELRDVVVPVPSTDDQERFVARLQEIGTATSQLADSLGLEELGALTEATLRKAFSGGL